jgi:cytidine deaminase
MGRGGGFFVSPRPRTRPARARAAPARGCGACANARDRLYSPALFEPLDAERDLSSDSSPAAIDAETARGLLDRAREARARAYAPYSNFSVGAALLADDGRVFTGCNVENASYGLTNCAERVAVGKAVSEGARRFRALAVVGPQDDVGCHPCGACRQVLHEFGPDLLVLTAEGAGGVRTASLHELLPGAFGKERLG